MRKVHDDIEETTWYFDPSSPRVLNQNAFFLYFGTKKGSEPGLWLRIQYHGDDWLFINKYVIKCDSESFEVVPEWGEVRRDNYDTVWEWYDCDANDYVLSMVQAVIASRRARLRYQGADYRKDRDITASEKQALKRVLDAFEAAQRRGS
jgi:hypothetical protein